MQRQDFDHTAPTADLTNSVWDQNSNEALSLCSRTNQNQAWVIPSILDRVRMQFKFFDAQPPMDNQMWPKHAKTWWGPSLYLELHSYASLPQVELK